MDSKELFLKYFPAIKRHWLPLSLGALGMIFFTYGLIGLFVSSKSASEDIVFESGSVKSSSTEAIIIVVDIEGAVVRPGLYKLPQDSRLQDGLIVAGGLSAAANRDYVAKNLNLAIKLTDGAKIYIPKEGEAESIKGSAQLLTGQININSATEQELDALPGVGPVTAQKIIGARPYVSVDELLDKKIVGSKVFNQIKDKISVY